MSSDKTLLVQYCESKHKIFFSSELPFKIYVQWPQNMRVKILSINLKNKIVILLTLCAGITEKLQFGTSKLWKTTSMPEEMKGRSGFIRS